MMQRNRMRQISAALAVFLVAVTVAGCGFTGASEAALPLREGTGSDSYKVTVEMAQIANLAPNAEVKVNDVTVGTVAQRTVRDWHAELGLTLDSNVQLPANATARVGQKSLLGAEYLELSSPTTEPPVGRLADGDVIPLNRTGRYPETEEVLSALSVVLNGGGLQQLRTITVELNRALGGRQGDIREFVTSLSTFVGALDAQRTNIGKALDGVNRLGGELAKENQTLVTALNQIPPALQVLNQQREGIVSTLSHVGDFGVVGTRVINNVRDDLLTNLRQLQPALGALADSDKDLLGGLQEAVSFPFPSTTTFPAVLKGDYGNLIAVVDLDPATIGKNLLGGFQAPIGGLTALRLPPLGASNSAPLAPLAPEPGKNGVSAPSAPAAPPAGGVLGGLFGGVR